MLDPYSIIQTIIKVTAKKRHQLTPRFGTCVLDPYSTTVTITHHNHRNHLNGRVKKAPSLASFALAANKGHLPELEVTGHLWPWELTIHMVDAIPLLDQ